MSFLDYCDTNYEAAKNDFDVLPLGEYLCRLDDVTIRDEADSVLLVFKLSVLDGAHIGRKIFKNVKITATEDMRTLKMAYSDLRRFGFFGKIGELKARPTTIVGQTIKVILKQSRDPQFPFINFVSLQSPARAAENARPAPAPIQPPAQVLPPPASELPPQTPAVAQLDPNDIPF